MELLTGRRELALAAALFLPRRNEPSARLYPEMAGDIVSVRKRLRTAVAGRTGGRHG
jgi:hypothetical protein